MSSHRVSIAMLVVVCAAAVLGKPLSIDVFENKDVLLAEKSGVVKRTTEDESSDDVAELSIPKISLSAFIDNLESSLFQTALSAGSVASDPSARVELITPAPVPKVSKRSITESEPEPIVLVQTTEKVSAADAVPAHVVIDRVSVYKAPVAGSALLPTFFFPEAPAIVKSDDADVDVEEDIFVVEATTIPETEDSSDSNSSESSESSEESKEVSSTVSSSPAPSSTTPVDEKKAAEEELKEKVAEVEAEPVILTARV